MEYELYESQGRNPSEKRCQTNTGSTELAFPILHQTFVSTGSRDTYTDRKNSSPREGVLPDATCFTHRNTVAGLIYLPPGGFRSRRSEAVYEISDNPVTHPPNCYPSAPGWRRRVPGHSLRGRFRPLERPNIDRLALNLTPPCYHSSILLTRHLYQLWMRSRIVSTVSI